MEPIATHIESTPGICSGRPRVAGTRIRVANIAIWTEEGMSPDEIVASYPQLTLADVHAALAYYHDHRADVDAQIREDERFVADTAGRVLLR
jgi:uncharacterized protein (DUF433 family)